VLVNVPKFGHFFSEESSHAVQLESLNICKSPVMPVMSTSQGLVDQQDSVQVLSTFSLKILPIEPVSVFAVGPKN
jgi:hypothetical protein